MEWIEEGLTGQPVTSDQVPTLPLCLGCPYNTTTVTNHHMRLGIADIHTQQTLQTTHPYSAP